MSLAKNRLLFYVKLIIQIEFEVKRMTFASLFMCIKATKKHSDKLM